MSRSNINLAIVRSHVRIQGLSEDEYDTANMLHQRISADNRYSDLTFQVVAWDRPQDWSKYTHIMLGQGINYSECTEEFLQWLASVPQDRVLNSPNIIRCNMNKEYLSELQTKHSISMPPTIFVNKDEEVSVAELERVLGNDRVVVKEIVDAGGWSGRLLDMSELRDVAQDLVRASRSGLIFQTYLHHIKTEGEWAVVFFDRKLSHVALKCASSQGREFRVQARWGGTAKLVEMEKVPQDVLDLANATIRTVPTQEKLFYARVDIVRDNNGVPCLMELEAFEPNLYLYKLEFIEHYLDGLRNY